MNHEYILYDIKVQINVTCPKRLEKSKVIQREVENAK